MTLERDKRLIYLKYGTALQRLFTAIAFFCFHGCVSGDSQLDEKLCANVNCGGYGACVVDDEQANCAW